MKKVKILTAAAFIFAIGSAFAPKTIANLRHSPKVVSFVPTAPCTATKDCPGTGSILCGYTSVGCANRINRAQ